MRRPAIHHRSGFSTTLGGGLLTLSLAALVACSESSTPPAAPAATASKTPAAASTPAAPAAAAKSETPIAKPVHEVVEQTTAATKAAAGATADAAKSIAEQAAAAVDPHAGHNHPPGEHDGHDHANDDASKVTNAADKIDALLKGQDTKLEESIDPNSKAKLTYEFGSDNKNFGKAMQGDVLKHTFLMKSGGEEDLVIKQAKPTCGCTVAQLMLEQADGSMAPYTFGGPIPPGRKVELNATLHTQNKQGHAASRINIFTNDPRGQTQFGLEAEVETFFLVNPPSLNFNQMAAKDSVTDKVSVTTSKGQRLKLTPVLNNVPPGLRVEVNALDADADGNASRWELVATAGPGLVEGPLAYSVPLNSDVALPGAETLPNGQAPTYSVSVTIMGQVLGTISFNPSFVSLGLIRPGQVVSRTIRVMCHDPEFKLTEPKVLVQSRDSGDWEYAKHFSSVVRPVPDQNAVDIELQLNGMPDTLNGSFNGMMVVQLGYPDKPELKLPITGVCRGGATTAAPAGASGPK
jgi:hypothetical protein